MACAFVSPPARLDMRPIDANHVAVLTLQPTPPFHFDGTVRKPSHFPSPDVHHEPGRYWQTLRVGRRLVGMRLTDIGSRTKPGFELAIFSRRPLPEGFCDAVAREIRWRFDLDADLGEFYARFRGDPLLGPVIRRWRGMRVSCAYSLYEFLVVTIVLQNATVRRSTQMLRALLERYGTPLRFDGKALYGFWTPHGLRNRVTKRMAVPGCAWHGA